MSPALILALAFLSGLLFGSFLNVCILRLPLDESLVSPRSRCPTCGHPIRWYDNIPLLSYGLLRGQCRDCGAAISRQYPAIELALGVWFAVCFLPLTRYAVISTDDLIRLFIHQLTACALGFFLIGLAVIDWRHHRLPDTLTIPGILIGLLLVCSDAIFLGPNDYNLVLQRTININAAGSGRSTGNVFLTGPEHLVYGRLVAVAACFLLLFSIRWLYRLVRKRDGMGLGDAKLLAMIASFIGLAPAILAFFAGTLFAAVYGMVLLLRRRATAATHLPFGSFLAAGGLIAVLVGTPLVDWYLALFR